MSHHVIMVLCLAAVVIGVPGQVPSAWFSWENCGTTIDPIRLAEFSLSPDPIVRNQNVTYSLRLEIDDEIKVAHDVTIVVTMYKRMFGIWIGVPCNDGFGSCMYPDLCYDIRQGTINIPFLGNGLPSSCPVPEGTYRVPPSSRLFEVDPQNNKIPGMYRVRVSFYRYRDKRSQLGCAETKFRVQ